jgi:uncharacterized protein (TIGR03089 family)
VPGLSATSLVDRLALAGGQPRLTWYGDGGERSELSGAVLAQWVTKTTNLLVEELDAGPGFRVRLDLPGHWRAVVWALGTWRVGACVVVGDDEPADAVVTSSPSWPGTGTGGTLVAVALPALARSFPAPLPPGAIDGTAVLGYGDTLGWAPPVDPAAPALVGPGGTTSHADLVPDDETAEADRVLIDATDTPLDALLRRVLATLAAGGSVVLVGGDFAAALRADDERRARLVATERVTVPS